MGHLIECAEGWTVELRGESVILHPPDGREEYDDPDCPHPEYLYRDVVDIIAALQHGLDVHEGKTTRPRPL